MNVEKNGFEIEERDRAAGNRGPSPIFSRMCFSQCRNAAYSDHRQMWGGSSVSVLLLIPIVLLVVLAASFVFFEGRKAYWDYRVWEMCEKDGGVKANETIDVDAKTYESLKNKFGQIDIPRSDDPRSAGAIAVHTYKDVYIRRSDPEVRRSELAVIRVSNGAVVATSTTYSRVGGELFALHPSYFSCPSAPKDFFASVINLKGVTK